MTGHLYAMRAAFIQRWLFTTRNPSDLSAIFNTVPIVALLAWLAVRNGNEILLTYVFFGAFFAPLWMNGVMRTGWLITDEVFQGTLELNLAARSPLFFVMLGKGLAQVSSNLVPGLVLNCVNQRNDV